jgi:hypothetical protein
MMNWKYFFAFLLVLVTALPAFAVDKPGLYLVAGKAFDATTAEDFGLVGFNNSR